MNDGKSNADLYADELILGAVNAAAAYFFAPLLVVTLPLLIVAVWRHFDSPSLRRTQRALLQAPIRGARAALALPARVRALPDQVRALPDKMRAALDEDGETTAPPVSRQIEAVHNPTGASSTTQPERRQVATAERPRWLSILNDEPDQRPHAMILGPTRSGKTTMATAAMGDRGGRAIVITPKVNPSNWRGAEIVTLDDDGSYADILATLDDIEQEKRARIKKVRKGEPVEPLTVVFDELGELAKFAPRAPEMMTELSSIGAELKVRIIGIGTSDEALGIKRWKATRNNYVRVEMDSDRNATVHDGVRSIRVKPRESVAMAERAQLTPWRGEVEAPASAQPARTTTTTNLRAPEPAQDDLLTSLLRQEAQRTISPERAARFQAIVERQGGDVHINVVQAVTQPARRTKDEAKTRMLQALYRTAGAEGLKFDEVYAEHKGTKGDVFPAWQEGKKQYDEAKSRSEAS